jgi:hypothetical protein
MYRGADGNRTVRALGRPGIAAPTRRGAVFPGRLPMPEESIRTQERDSQTVRPQLAMPAARGRSYIGAGTNP